MEGMPMRDGRRVRFVTLIGVLAACSWLVPGSALASFPGSNGAVAYGGFDGTDDEIVAVGPTEPNHCS
jgi:hypothetical protein